MNERIRELMAQAGFDPASIERMGVMPNAEKFAELVVLECVRYFNEDYQRDWSTQWREDLSSSIKEHFGVEK